MEENSQDAVARACATLSSLRKNIDQMTAYSVSETYVHEFHSVLDRLDGIGIDVSEFRIPDSEVKPRMMSSSWDDEVHNTYSEDKYVDKSFILTKLDAILGYLEIITSEKPRRIGFRKPEK